MLATLSLLKDLQQEDKQGLVGRKCKVKDPDKHGTCMKGILKVVSIQRVWGYDEQGNYTMVDGCRVTGRRMKDQPIPHTPIALNELEWV